MLPAEVNMDIMLLGVGLLAGVLTTIAGMGGGLFLLAVLGARTDPHTALAWVTPALLLGNLHRSWIYRAEVDRGVARRVLLAAGPPSLLAALGVELLPALLLRVLLVGVAALGVVALLLPRPAQLPRAAQAALAALGGLVSATSGGAGVMLGPVLLSAGLRARAYVASMAVVAVALHLTRLLAFGLNGRMDAQALGSGLALALAVMAGNRLGDGLLPRLGARTEDGLQALALGLSALVALLEDP